MKQWLALLVAVLCIACAPEVVAGGPVTPQNCVGLIDKPNLPSSGGTVGIDLNCPTPAPDGIYAVLLGPTCGSGCVFIQKGPGQTYTGGLVNFINVPPNSTSSPVNYTWTWHICDNTTRVACNDKTVTTTVAAAPPPVPVCSPLASNLTPQVGQSVLLTANCTNGPTSYSWTNCASTSATCNATSSVPGQVTYTVVATNAGGSSAPANVTVTWQPLTPSAPVCSVSANDTSPQVGTSILLSANCSNSPTSYGWTNCSSTGSTCIATSGSPGPVTYSVAGINAGGTGAAAGVLVNWQPPGAVPSCSISASNTSPQAGSTITVSSSCSNNPTSYTWTGCTSTTSSCTDTVSTAQAKTYTLVASNGFGNSGVASINVQWGGPPLPPPPPEAGTVVEAATGGAGTGFSALLRSDGTLWSWGDNTQKTLGDGTSSSRSVPGRIEGLENIQAATVGSSFHTLALDIGGHVYAWGQNAFGELGIGNRTQQTRPTPIPGLSSVAEVAAGNSFSLARRADGSVWAWGHNHLGQLGDGSGVDQLSPIQIAGLSNVVSIAAGANHAAVADASGRVFVWGDNLYVPTNQSNRPIQVPITNVIAVFIGGDNTFALKGDGSVWAWGLADSGRLGDGGSGDGRTPVQVKNVFNVRQVFAGDTSSMALLADGTLWGWGKNEKGQLGLNNTTTIGAPVKLTLPVPQIAGAAAGDSHFIIDPQGRMYGAGSNELGTLGLGDLLETRAPELVAGIGSVTAVAASATQSIALRADGSVAAWGAEDPNDIGSSNSTPHPVAGLVGRFVAIAGGSQNAIAVRDDGAVFGWGKTVPGSAAPSNASAVVIGALGNVKTAATGGTGVIALTNAGRALIACGLGPCPGTDFNFTNVTAVAAGLRHFLVLRADGTVYGWGANDKGQLGDGSLTTPSAPVRVANLSNVRAIAAGAEFSVAVTADGRTYAWGQAPPFTSIKTVAAEVIELKGTVQISAAAHVLSLDGLGRAQSWGLGAKVGERDHLAPGREPRMDNLVALAAGTNHSLGVTASGEVVAWGQNAFQQLGVFRKRTSPTWVQVNDPANAVNTQNAVPVVEFVNPSIGYGHYFITAFGAEQKDLDTGTKVKGWQRSGRSWRAWLDQASAPASAKPVYRFFSSKFNTHFYTADEAEKSALVAGTDWGLEAVAFYAAPSGTTCPSLQVTPISQFLCKSGPPTAVDCPTGYYPVYRAFDVAPGTKRTDPNHRFTPNWIDIYRNVRFHGYVYEGVAFCSPASAQLGGDLQAFHVYPGDSANAGDFLSGEYWFGNAGPGAAHGATMVAAMPDGWTVTCAAYNGAQCPGNLAQKSLREGVAVTTLPAGGVLKLTASGVAPAQPEVLRFASSIGAPSLAPDPYPNNNAAPVSQTNVKSAAACMVALTPSTIALLPAGSTASVDVSAPAGCSWSASGEDFAAAIPATGTGNGTIKVTAAVNNSGGERSAGVTVSTNGQPAQIAVRQAAVQASTCSSVTVEPAFAQLAFNQLPNNIISVRTPTTDCTWDVKIDGDWIVLAGASRTGTGQVEYAVLANPANDARSGTITIGNKVFNVHQAGGNGGVGGDSGGDGGGSGGGSGGGAGG